MNTLFGTLLLLASFSFAHSAEKGSNECEGLDTLELAAFDGTRIQFEKGIVCIYDSGGLKVKARIDSSFYLRRADGSLMNTGTPRDRITRPYYQKSRKMAALTSELCRESVTGVEKGLSRAAEYLLMILADSARLEDSLQGDKTRVDAWASRVEDKGRQLEALEEEIVNLHKMLEAQCPDLARRQSNLQ